MSAADDLAADGMPDAPNVRRRVVTNQLGRASTSRAGLWFWEVDRVLLLMVLLLIGYHLSARMFMKRMLRDAPLPRSVTLRWYNEAPVLILLVILWLVVVKPF